MNPWLWLAIAPGAFLAGLLVLVACIAAWCWMLTVAASARSWYQASRPAPPDIAGKAPLEAGERAVLRRIEERYGATADEAGWKR